MTKLLIADKITTCGKGIPQLDRMESQNDNCTFGNSSIHSIVDDDNYIIRTESKSCKDDTFDKKTMAYFVNHQPSCSSCLWFLNNQLWDSGIMLCKHTGPIIRKTDGDCEIQLFKKEVPKSGVSTYRTLRKRDLFTKMVTGNTWLFSFIKPKIGKVVMRPLEQNIAILKQKG